jgi:cell wall-associated NlpC family hydrolase
MRTRKLLTIALGLALLSGCMSNPGDTRDLKSYSGPVKVKSNGQSPADITEGRHIVPIKTIQNAPYISLDDFTKATGYHGAWLRNGSYGVGDNDPAWIFRTGESTVNLAGKNVRIPAQTVKEGTGLYVSVSALKPLFGDVTVFEVDSGQVSFFPNPTPGETGVTGRELNFSDGPSSAIADSTRGKMIGFAKKYMGVKYEFGTEAYDKSGTFDCSTFVQHVYGHYGMEMPRMARQQATYGKQVDRNNLKKGDLLFFYMPGRYKSNKTIGHVGMYDGGGKMIHASPKPEDGVQLTNINTAYWKETFLYARRLF